MSSQPQYNVQAAPFKPGGGSTSTNVENKSQSSRNKKPSSGGSRGKHQHHHSKKQPNSRNNRNNRRRENEDASNRSDKDTSSAEDLISQGARNKRGEVSISHLMDFTPLRRPNNNSGPPPPRRRANQPRKWTDPQAEKIAYINTTCRFILNPGVDYDGLMNDPDSPVPMDNVMRIITQASSCPICLEDVPEAPRMMECGHIICYPCLFRFLKSENIIPPGETKPKKHKECPFCFERVRPYKVKPVTFSMGNDLFDTPKEDNEVVLTLMFRPMDSYLAVPNDIRDDPMVSFKSVPTTDMERIMQYSRISMGTAEYMISEYDREIRELEINKKESNLLYEDNGVFYQEAIDNIKQIKKVYEEPEPSEPAEFGEPSFSWDDSEKTVEQGMADLSVSTKTESYPQPRKDRQHYDDSNAYFFYQTGFDTITKFFLAPLDVKILRAAYGSYGGFPSSMAVKVQNVLYGTSVTPEIRKRMKYLAHLPVYTQLGFLECDWKGLVPNDVLSQFSKELQNRRKKKKDKERKEERDRKRYQREEEESFRHELMQESYLTSSYIQSYSTPIPPPPSILAEDPALPSNKNGDSTGQSEGSSNNGNDNGISFAAVASGEVPVHERQRQIDEIMSGAQPKRKGGKKLVLMSNR